MTRGLPVLRTCAECKYCTAMGRPNVKVPRRPLTPTDLARIVAFWHCENEKAEAQRDNTGVFRIDPNAAPPDGCPLPRAEADRELLHSAASRGFALAALASRRKPLDAETEINRIVDAVLAERSRR